MRRLGLVCLCLTATLAWAAPEIHNLELVGQLPLGPGFNASVWVHKNTAYVGTWGTAANCPAAGVKLVDLTDPASPRLLGRLASYPNTSAESMVVRHMETSYFRGDVLAVGLQACRNSVSAKRGVELFDVTNPRFPRELGFFDTGSESRGVHELDLVQRADGRVLVLLATIARFRLVDATDPTHPRQISYWNVTEQLGESPSSSKFVHSALASADGTMAFLSYWDAGVILLDIADPTNPQMVGRARNSEDANAHSVSVSSDMRLMLAANENLDPGSAADGYTDWGYLRVFDISNPASPRQVGTFLTTHARTDRTNGPTDAGAYSIRNPYLAGGFGYLSWYSDGVRVVDLGNPSAPQEVASYVPPDNPDPYGVFANRAQVWSVMTQSERNLVVASDVNFGLYVLRPLEPKPDARGVLNAAAFNANAPVAPGSLVTVMGSQLAGTVANGEAFTLGGASVRVNGEPAQVLYASPEQINFVMPPATPLGTARVTLENLGRPSAVIDAQVADTAPGVFTNSHDGRGPASAVRMTDQTAITADRPARAGELIELFVTGMGVRNASVSVQIGGEESQILSATSSMLLVRVPAVPNGQASVVVTANGRAGNVATLPVE